MINQRPIQKVLLSCYRNISTVHILLDCNLKENTTKTIVEEVNEKSIDQLLNKLNLNVTNLKIYILLKFYLY